MAPTSEDHQTEKRDRNEEEGRPPIFRTWKQMYLFVLFFHAFIITLFYLLTRTYA